ncbi:MAG: hypothetical protein HZA50_07300 [Planctomycetes bacterium]|nr:hypothetical protein [Planctomycetota bacterium]
MAESIVEIPEQCCLNCAFCGNKVFTLDLANNYRVAELRQQALKLPNDWDRIGIKIIIKQNLNNLQQNQIQNMGWSCVAGIFAYLLGNNTQDVARLIEDRTNQCFFYPYHIGLTIEAAKELERRAAGRREAEKDRALNREISEKNLRLTQAISEKDHELATKKIKWARRFSIAALVISGASLGYSIWGDKEITKPVQVQITSQPAVQLTPMPPATSPTK